MASGALAPVFRAEGKARKGATGPGLLAVLRLGWVRAMPNPYPSEAALTPAKQPNACIALIH